MSSSIIALDVGEQRIGVAVASLMARLPRPLTTFKRSEQTIQELRDLIAHQDVVTLVIGLPRGLEGQETAQTTATRQFVEELKKSLTLPIHVQDEAVTSLNAEAELNARKRPYNKADIDALSATFILQDFLNEHPNGLGNE